MVNDAEATIASMTGFAAREGGAAGYRWNWELRSVNARGLDLRLRLPEGYGGLEAPLRKELSQAMARGSVSLNLRLTRDLDSSAAQLDPEALAAALKSIEQIAAAAEAKGVTLAAVSPAEILALKGVAESGAASEGPSVATLLADAGPLIAALVTMRATEGAALAEVLGQQIDRIADLTQAASQAASDRTDAQAARFRANLAAILEASEGLDEARIAQELATLAVKSDVSEEVDRLGAHIAAARALLTQGGPVGRKLDFLMQEFNREANTLCSKSGDAALTAIGLDLKLAIDQMREQVQNVE